MPRIFRPQAGGTAVSDSGVSAGTDDLTSKSSDLLSSYPRSRPHLSQDHQRIYVAHYLDNREGSGALTRLKNRMEGWMHRRIALHPHGIEVLEIGAGTLNHLQYEPDGLSYDAVEPFRELWDCRSDLQRLRNMYQSIEEIPDGNKYDRIFSIAVLEHLTDLPRIIAAAGLRLRPEGYFQAGIPSEGGLLWGLAWRLSTGIAFRLRTGLDYAQIMRHEHVSTSREILGVCNWFFEEVTIQRFPTGLHHFSFYAVIEARHPRLERCRELLQDRSE